MSLLESYWYLLRKEPYPETGEVIPNNIKAVRERYAELREDGFVLEQGVGKRPSTYGMGMKTETRKLASYCRSTRLKKRARTPENHVSLSDGSEEDKTSDRSAESDNKCQSEKEESGRGKSSSASNDSEEVGPADYDDESRPSKSRCLNTLHSKHVNNVKRTPRTPLSLKSSRALHCCPISDDKEPDDEYQSPLPNSKKRNRKVATSKAKARPTQFSAERIRSCPGCRFHKKGACTGQTTTSRVIGQACKPCIVRGGDYVQWCANDTWPARIKLKR